MVVEIPSLPETPEQWKNRIHELTQELRREDLKPCRGHLYQRDHAGVMSACVEGVINEMAMRGGIHAQWVDFEIEDDHGRPLTVWEALLNAQEYLKTEPTNRALSDAIFYHGMYTPPTDDFTIDVFDCDPDFVREVINGKHGLTIGTAAGASLNDNLVSQGANPLLVAADIIEHLLERPHSSIWNRRVQYWAERGILA